MKLRYLVLENEVPLNKLLHVYLRLLKLFSIGYDRLQ